MKKFFAFLVSMSMLFSLSACDDSNSNDHEGEAKAPSGSTVQKGEDYQDVAEEFRSRGFTNIKFEPIDDLILGWLTEDGEVESVSVDGDENYSSGKWYPQDVEVVISFHTFPQKSQKDDNANTTPESEKNNEPDALPSNPQEKTAPVPDPVPESNEILSVENCDDFSSILLLKDESDPAIGDFANTYKNKTIEFDGCIIYVVNHGSYDTRYDILISAGDYVDADTANPGPVFKFEDVNTFDMGIKDLYLPDFISIGNNVHITAKILEFNDDSGLFFLEPILVQER